MWKQWAAAPLTADSNFMAMDYPYDSGHSWIYGVAFFFKESIVNWHLNSPIISSWKISSP